MATSFQLDRAVEQGLEAIFESLDAMDESDEAILAYLGTNWSLYDFGDAYREWIGAMD